MNFLKAARVISNIETTIEKKRETSKFKVVPNSKNFFYIPVLETKTTDENGNEVTETSPVAYALNIHEWNDASNHYNATYCTSGIREEGHSGACPICKAASECWNKYNYLKAQAEAECEKRGLTGKAAEDFMDEAKKKALNIALTVKGAKPYLYMLVAQFEKNEAGKTVIDTATGLPKFALKIIKWSDKRREEVATQFKNSGLTLEGSEIVLQYSDIPKGGDKSMVRLTTTPVFGKAMVTVEYPEVVEAINKAVAKFDFAREAEEAFIEMHEMTDAEAEIAMAEVMKDWREFELARKSDATLTYLPENLSGEEVSLTTSITTDGTTEEENSALDDIDAVLDEKPATEKKTATKKSAKTLNI